MPQDGNILPRTGNCFQNFENAHVRRQGFKDLTAQQFIRYVYKNFRARAGVGGSKRNSVDNDFRGRLAAVLNIGGGQIGLIPKEQFISV